MSFQKRAPRYSTSDWFTRSYTNWTNSERTRKESEKVRWGSKILRSDVDNKTRWDQMDSNCRISDRIDRIRVIKRHLEIRLESLNKELEFQQETKDGVEKAQAWFYRVCQVNTENLVWREGRRDIDLTVDEAEIELHKERVLLDTVRSKLQNKISELFEQMGLLKELRKKVMECLQRKNETLDIDIEQYNLNEDSPNISLKPDPTRIPANTLTVDQWEDFCASLLCAVDCALGESVKLRETVQNVIDTIHNDVYSQNLAVIFALRKRVHELQMAIDENKYQKKLLEEEAERIENEIRCIDIEIELKTRSLKLVHSRLENRLYRTEEDLCRDSAQYGLTDEAQQIVVSLSALRERKCQAQHALHCIEKQIHRLNTDLENKQLSLRIDQQCIESRKRFEKPGKITGHATESLVKTCPVNTAMEPLKEC